MNTHIVIYLRTWDRAPHKESKKFQCIGVWKMEVSFQGIFKTILATSMRHGNISSSSNRPARAAVLCDGALDFLKFSTGWPLEFRQMVQSCQIWGLWLVGDDTRGKNNGIDRTKTTNITSNTNFEALRYTNQRLFLTTVQESDSQIYSGSSKFEY